MKCRDTRGSSYLRVVFAVFGIVSIVVVVLAQRSDRKPLPLSPIIAQKTPKETPKRGIDTALQSGAGNEISNENALPGSPASEWDISGSGDPAIQGFATNISVDQGQTVDFKIDATSPYKVDIYRLGYYGGLGARHIATIDDKDTIEADQPACTFDDSGDANLTDCGNWSVSASWSVPPDATSGIYIAKPTRLDTSGASHIVFIVRDDDGQSDVLFQTSDTTWQAYNQYGGYSLYGGPGSLDGGHAHKVSYNRPFTVRGDVTEDWLFNAEYPMLRWLERNGYDVSYSTDVDSDRHGAEILEHKIFMSVGHDEYWSAGQRANVEAARDAGINLAFFSGNEIYWKTRWENTYRTLVSYKEGNAQGTAEHWNCLNNFDCDPHPTEWTGLWRQNQTGHDAGRPENSLSGQISWGDSSAAIQVPAATSGFRFWRNIGISGSATLENNTLGYEFDWEQPQYADNYPAGRITFSETTAVGKTHRLSLYRAPSGALVFGAGTVQWMWGLDGNHDRGTSTEDPRMQQATVNILSDMGAQPVTLQTGLAAGGPLDTVLPSTDITSPTDGTSLPGGSITVTGTAVDTGGLVASVEVSTDGGTTWKKADGTTNWSFTFGAPVGSMTIRARSIDDAANIGAEDQISLTLSCPCSIWSLASGGGTTYFDGPVELGTKFRSSVNGYVTAIRYWNAAGTSGTRVGHLWDTSGTMMAEATFAPPTGTGWQEVQLSAPVAITANATYIASYHAPGGYTSTNGYFASSGVSSTPLRALQEGEDGSNGVYRYGLSGTFPVDSFQSSNYWVDVVFSESVAPDMTPPTLTARTPADLSTNNSIGTNVTATFSEGMDQSTISGVAFELRKQSDNTLVPSSVSYNSGSRTATLDPNSNLEYSTAYVAKVTGGESGVKDAAGNPLASDASWTFTTAATSPIPPDEGPGGPILVVSAVSNPFSRYYAEILRAEGLNEFRVKDLTTVDSLTLAGYDVVILGDIPVNPSQAAMFANWVNDGGNLVAMSPDANLASLLGLVPDVGSLSEGYLLVNTATAPGSGIVGQTIQYHGTADRYALDSATSVAMLYSDTTTATTNPAVTIRSVGTNGGQAAAFTFDLARSVVYTRQGNPAWAGQERDGESGPIRPNDMFFPDWVNLDKVSIPQADEQQRLLSNLIGLMNFDKKPLPRFWFLPDRHKAAVVMTGDDHGTGGTGNAFDYFISQSTPGCSVDEWKCIRGTSYVYPGTPINSPGTYQAQGFEIGLHVSTGCNNYSSQASLDSMFTDQLGDFNFAGVSTPKTLRTHCIAWSDWSSAPKVSLAHGIRLDTNYYYWPGSWVQDRPGMFTGSSSPMRFADVDGTMIDVYQAATQITDESGQTYSTHINSLLDNALGSSGYYGVFTVNMHTDSSNYPSAESPHSGAIAIVDSAKSRGVPVVSAKQMLTWLDGRNNSTIGITSWNGGILSFNINAAPGSTDLTSMIPTVSNAGNLVAMTKDGSPISYITETVKGVQYAFFASETGGYTATYSADVIAPTVVSVTPTDSATDVAVNTSPTATFNEAMDPVTINSTSVELRDGSDNLVPAATSFAGNTVTIDPNEPLSGSSTYSVTIKSGSGGARDVAGNPLATDFTWSFTTTTANPYNCPCSVWSDSPDLPTNPNGFDPGHTIETGVKFRAAIDGYITGVRFYKGTSNTGTHVGHLWSSSGVKLAEATFTGESASGWQTVTFAPAVAVTANTTYVASYYSSSGYFAYTGGGLSTSISNGPITLLAAGTDGANGVFLYDPAAPGGFPSSGSNANYWIDVVFNTDPGDTTPPQITSRYPAPNDYGVPLSANVTVTFNEAMNLSTINGTTMRLRKDGGLVDIPAVVSVAGLNATLNPAGPLDPNAVYRVTVSASVADTSNNPIGSDVSWTFVTAPTEFTDWSAEHFTAGTSASTHVALETDGEVILTPTVGDEFAGTALDAQWVTHLWSAGGSASVEAGQLISNGSRIGTVNTFAAGRSLEFVATFGAATFQHVGFGVDYENPPLAIFSTFNTTNQLFARTNNGVATVDTPLGNLIGSPHRYRIEWLPTSVAYYVDDVLVATHNVPIAVELRPLISDFEDSQPGVSVDWIRMSEFASPGTFVSRVFDSGDQAEWMQLVFNADLPFGTSITLETRSGDTPLPDGSWSEWLPTSGASIESGDARYLQYRAVLTSSLSSITPTLFDVSLSYRTLRSTAADVVISGRVLSRSGRPIQRAIVQLVDQTGNVQRVTTNTLGYYRFDGISAESMVVLSASSRRYTFETRLIRVSDSIYDLEIIGIDR